MTTNEIPLAGCSPTPLANYLKALGVLRLIASPTSSASGNAADPEARGCWENERFHLHTHLDCEELTGFFLEDYTPSPLIGAWNGRAGFLEDENSKRSGAELIRKFEGSCAERFAPIHATITRLRDEPLLAKYSQLRDEEKNEKDEERKKALKKKASQVKNDLLPHLRGKTDSRHLALIDAAFVLGDESRAAPLLGSGFSDGSRDFGVNFLEQIQALFNVDDGKPTNRSAAELKVALFSSTEKIESTGTMGQFSPGQGGANATTGYEGKNPLNPWDVIFTLEGALLWSGALTCRWGTQSTGKAAFPFTYEPNMAGSGALSIEDPNTPRGEIWVPLWSKPCSLVETESLFAEGRITLGRRVARTGLDAARAIAQLGISRGIAAFERYSMIQSDRKMPYQATPLGRFKAPLASSSDLISDFDIDGWLSRVRRLAREKGAPARARAAVKQLEDALFAMSETHVSPRSVQGALGALGDLVGWLADSREAFERISPPPRLSYKWVRKADDETPEYRVAAALASLGWRSSQNARQDASTEESESSAGEGRDTDTVVDSAAPKKRIALAAHFAPLDAEAIPQKRRKWDAQKQTRVVWGAGGFESNLIAVLQRRLIDEAIAAPLDAEAPARLTDLEAFLAPDFDDVRCARLLAGLVWAQPGHLNKQPRRPVVPFAYAVLKPLFAPDTSLKELAKKGLVSPDCKLPIPPGLIARLRSGRVEEAVRLALARARASGITCPFANPGIPQTTRIGRRLAAALLIPLEECGLQILMERAYPAEKENEDGD